MKSTFLKYIVLFITLPLIPIESQFAQSSKKQFELSPYIKLNSYSWKEFDENSNELLSESGFIFGIGTEGKYFFTKKKNVFISSDLQLYFLKVDYDGFLQGANNTRTPYKNKTGYFGMEWLVDFAYAIQAAKKISFIPSSGFGLEYWKRDLDDGGQYGYNEYYTVFLFNIAAQAKYIVNKKISLNSALLIKIPLSISENIDGSGRVDPNPIIADVSPGISPRIRFEIGASIYNFIAVLFFETWTLPKSDDVQVTVGNQVQSIHQPESVRKWLGLKLGYAFSF